MFEYLACNTLFAVHVPGLSVGRQAFYSSRLIMNPNARASSITMINGVRPAMMTMIISCFMSGNAWIRQAGMAITAIRAADRIAYRWIRMHMCNRNERTA